MNEVLQQAAKYYEACMPIKALHKLEELKKESEKSIQLKSMCIKMLIQQAPYLLKEFQSHDDFVEMRTLIEEYKKYVGNDKSISTYSRACEAYEAKCKQLQTEINIKQAQKIDRIAITVAYTIGILGILGVIIFSL